MKLFRTEFLLPSTIVLLQLLLTPPLAGGNLEQRMANLHARFGVRPENAGILMVEYPSGRTLYQQNPDTPYIPASNMKLLTALAALDILGPDHKFQTTLYEDDPDSSDASIRHLYVKGGGDPTLSGRFYRERTTVFRNWARKLRSGGIKSIRGNLVLDDTIYESVQRHSTWNRYQHSFWYTAPVNGLPFNDNCVYVRVLPRSPGQKAKITVDPPGSPIRILNQTRTVSEDPQAGIKFKRLKNTWKIRVRGHIRPKTARREWITVPDATRFFGTVFNHVLEQRGIDVRGRVRRGSVPDHPAPDRLLVHRTPLKKALRVTLENSQNLFAETLFKQIGHIKHGTGSWPSAVRTIRSWLDRHGPDRSVCRIVDGSGLSRQNRLTPRFLVGLLRRWVTRDELRTYLDRLPVAGVKGTLDDRLTDAPYKGRIAAKTGTLDGVISLSGIAGKQPSPREDRPLLLFSILVNQSDLPSGRARHFVDNSARAALDELLRRRR